MSQLEAPEVSALEGDPVDTPAEPTVETAETTEQTADPLDALYPDDQQRSDGEEPTDEPDGEEPDGEADEVTDDEDEPDEPAIDPPHSWKAEAKAHWDALPRETQEYLRQRDQEQTQFVNAKAQEAARARTEVQQQAEVEIAQFREQQAQQYRVLAAQVLPPEPDERLLYSDDPNADRLYRQQEAAYRRGLAQHHQLQQAAEQESAEAQRIREGQEQQARQVDIQRLNEAYPEMFDEAKGPAIVETLNSTARLLGYPDELLSEANANDVLALKTASEWKADAEKWRAYQASRRDPAGRFKTARRQPSTPNKPGSGQRAPANTTDPVKLLYPND